MIKVDKKSFIPHFVLLILDIFFSIAAIIVILNKKISLSVDFSIDVSVLTISFIVIGVSSVFFLIHLYCIFRDISDKKVVIIMPIVYFIINVSVALFFLLIVGTVTMSTGDKYFQNCSSTTIDSTNIDKEYSYKSRYDLYSSISTFVGKQRNMEQSLIANNNDSVNAGKYMDYNEDYSAFYTKMNSKWLYNKIEKLDEETIYENLEGLTIDVKQTDDYILYSGKGIRKEDGDDLYEVHYYLVIDNNSDTYYNANYYCIGSNDNRGYNKYSEKQFISDAIKNYQNSQKLKFFLMT